MAPSHRMTTSFLTLAIWAGLSAAPLSASTLWGSNVGGGLGPRPLRIRQIDHLTGADSNDILIEGEDSRAGVLDFASDPQRDGSVVWSLHYTEHDGSQLMSFDPHRRETLSLVSLDGSLDIRGLAIDPTTGTMYGTSETALYRLNPSNGAADLMGSTSEELDESLGFDLQGNLYGMNQFGYLFRIDKSNGATTNVGELTAYPADLAVRPEDGVMYGLGQGDVPLFGYGLFTVDLETAEVTLVGPSVFRPGALAFTIVPEPSSMLLAAMALSAAIATRTAKLLKSATGCGSI